MKLKFDFDRIAVQGIGSGVLGGALVVISLIMGDAKITIPDSTTVIDGVLPMLVGTALLIVCGIMMSVWFGSIFIEEWLNQRNTRKQNSKH